MEKLLLFQKFSDFPDLETKLSQRFPETKVKKEFPFLPKRRITQAAFIIAPSTIAFTFVGVYGSSNTSLQDRLGNARYLLSKSREEHKKLARIHKAAMDKRDYLNHSLEVAKQAQINNRTNKGKIIETLKDDLDNFEQNNAGLFNDHKELVQENEGYREKRREQNRCLPALKHGKRHAPECRASLYRLFKIDTSKKPTG